MRKVIYSNILKIIAVVLFIASIVLGTLTVTNGVMKYCEEEEEIYSLENDFSESWYVQHLLDTPKGLMYNIYHSTFYRCDDDECTYEKVEKESSELQETLRNKIEEQFGNYYNFDKLNYYVQWNDVVFTNCGAKTADELLVGECYSYLKLDKDGSSEYKTSAHEDSSHDYWHLYEVKQDFDDESTIIVSCSIKESTVNEYKAIWEKQEGIVMDAFYQGVACIVVMLLALIYLLCVCGKNAEGECSNMWLDNIWIEVHLATMAGVVVGAVALCWSVLEAYNSMYFNTNLVYWSFGIMAAVVGLVIISSLLSNIRNIKNRKLLETSIILRVIRWCFRTLKKIVCWIWKKTKSFWKAIFRLLSKKTGIILIGMLFAYTLFVGILGILTHESPMPIVIGILLFGFAAFVVARRSADLDEIKKGVGEVRNGNVAYKIPELKCEDMKALAANVNDIAMGLDESVAAKMKAERLKTELITNVSHDIKTPITSIISYTELLSKVENLPEEARDYVSVIAKKSKRLKNLTQDLFDISKVQSGNDEVVLEKLDVSLLVGQALGEQDNEIQNSGLQFCVHTPKELYISADGRKMSRVLSNLINNILKYTMKNTRVFITATEKADMIEVELKNISAYPLNFDAEEITQRFVRGDESRTADGNGLGLAIAKSYTEICNGAFEIVVDGDMFKAILKFKKYV